MPARILRPRDPESSLILYREPLAPLEECGPSDRCEERGLTTADDDAVLDAMAAEPRLIERPLVETDKGVRLCRPPERVTEIL